jgi:hypothetical protein
MRDVRAQASCGLCEERRGIGLSSGLLPQQSLGPGRLIRIRILFHPDEAPHASLPYHR